MSEVNKAFEADILNDNTIIGNDSSKLSTEKRQIDSASGNTNEYLLLAPSACDEKKRKVLIKPEEPTDCCGSGCKRCVWDKYYDECAAYEESLFYWNVKK